MKTPDNVRAMRAAQTKPLSKVVRAMGAETRVEWPATIVHTFDDGTGLRVTGRGRNYKVTYEWE